MSSLKTVLNPVIPARREPGGDVVVIVIRDGKVVRFETAAEMPAVNGINGDGI